MAKPGPIGARYFAEGDLRLMKKILLDHAAHCTNSIKDIACTDAGLVLYKRAEDARQLMNKINEILGDG
jgi:hypothetical protein